MADVKKIATREGYSDTLVELCGEIPNLYVFDADLAGATKTGKVKKAYPDRFFDCGIAEQNMMCIAAGEDHELHGLPHSVHDPIDGRRSHEGIG